jgi:soluble lytic murein transglycosylase
VYWHKPSDARTVAASIGDPVAQKLVEWALLRDADSFAGFDRLAAFIQADPDWPSTSLLRRRAEAKLWQERRNPGTVHRFVGDEPTSTAGRLALARVLMGEGNRVGAEREVRAVWRSAEMSAELSAPRYAVPHHAHILARHPCAVCLPSSPASCGQAGGRDLWGAARIIETPG